MLWSTLNTTALCPILWCALLCTLPALPVAARNPGTILRGSPVVVGPAVVLG